MPLSLVPQSVLDLQKQHEELAATAKSRRGKKPTKKPTRAQLEYAFSMMPRLNDDGMTVSVVSHAYPPCTTPLADLEPITISDLRLETHHRGKVLVVYVFGHPYRDAGILNAIEDRNGDVDRLVVFNLDPDVPANQLIWMDGIFAIKEPYYKQNLDGGPCIRVDHPSDLVGALPQYHELVPSEFKTVPASLPSRDTVADDKERGNQFFRKQQWDNAERYYSKAIKRCGQGDDAMRHDLYRNRALVNIHLGRFEQAVKDAKSALLSDDGYPKLNSKAYHRAGIASYQLGDYESARAHFEQARTLQPSDPDTEREFGRAVARVVEQQNGDINLLTLSNKVTKQNRRLDHANYTARVDVRDTPGRGRGLFAREDIKAGELVLLEKAYRVVFDNEEKSNVPFTMHLHRESMSMGAHAALLVRLIQDALKNPDTGRELLSLHDEGYQPKSGQIVDDTLAVDVFQMHQILESNAFHCSALRTTDDIQAGSIEALLAGEMAQGGPAKFDPSGSCGIWLLASRMNHACDANVAKAFIGDLMVAHATKDIKADDELFVGYVQNDGNHANTIDNVHRWGFQCGCRICAAEEKTPKSEREIRENLVQQANDFFNEHSITMIAQPVRVPALLIQAEAIFERLERTYDSEIFRDVPRLGLCKIGMWVAMVYLSQGKHAKVARQCIATMRNYGYKVAIAGDTITIDNQFCAIAPEVVDAAVNAMEAFARRGKRGIAQRLKTFAKEAYKTLYGTVKDIHKMYSALA